jgi:hypothetical protein
MVMRLHYCFKMEAQDQFDEPVTAVVLARATARGGQRRHPGLHAVSVTYLSAMESLLIGFADQSAVVLPVRNYPELTALGPTELERLAIGYGGGARCLEERDLHVSIAGAGVGQSTADGQDHGNDEAAST